MPRDSTKEWELRRLVIVRWVWVCRQVAYSYMSVYFIWAMSYLPTKNHEVYDSGGNSVTSSCRVPSCGPLFMLYTALFKLYPQLQ